MPITSFTIDGDEVDPLVESFEIRETSGDVATLSCDIDSVGSPVLRFSVHAEIIVEEDGVRIFAGNVTQTRERGFAGEPNLYDPDSGVEQIVTTVTAEDFGRLAERIHVTETVADGTLLKTFLTTLVTNWLGGLGVTLHPSQVNGPPLPAMTFDLASGGDVLRALTDATGYPARIDYDKQLRMWAPGELVAPFNINEFDDPASWTGDVEVETIIGDDFANRVIVIGDLITEQYRVESFVGDGVTDTFQLEYNPTQFYGYVTRDAPTNAFETLTFEDAIGTATWTYYAGTNSIKRETGPPEIGADIQVRFDGTLRPYAVAEPSGLDPADVVEVVVHSSEVKTNEAAQALADSLLVQRMNADQQQAFYSTRFTAPTLHVGQQQTIAATPRQLAGTYLITEMSIQAETPATTDFASIGFGLLRRVRARKDNTLAGKWQQTYRDWLTDTSGAGAGTDISGTANVGPAPPIRSVQFNDGGFGGDEAFIYYKDENSLVCGGDGSSITATEFESSQVFGSNCHIADA